MNLRRIKRLLRPNLALIEHIEYAVTRGGIIMPEAYRRSTFGQSLHPRSEDLLRLDLNGGVGVKANLGRIVIPPPVNPEGLQVGDPVMFDQHSAPVGYTLAMAQQWKRFAGTEGLCFLIPTRNILGVLPELPTVSRFL